MNKTERQLNLVFLLINTKRGFSRSQIQEQISDYRESKSQLSFERMFERDKEEIKALGFVLDTNLLDIASSDEFTYRIHRDSSFVKFDEFSMEEKLVLQMAVIYLQKRNMLDTSLNLKVEANFEYLPIEVELNNKINENFLVSAIRAIQERRQIFFDYMSGNANEGVESTRQVTPLHLMVKNGFYYLIGFSHDREDYRVFRMDRILRFIDFGEKDEASYLIDKKDDLINLLELANPILNGSFQIIEKNKLDSADFPAFNLTLNGKDAQFNFRASMTDSLTRYFAMNLDCVSDIHPQALASKLDQLLKSKFNEK